MLGGPLVSYNERTGSTDPTIDVMHTMPAAAHATEVGMKLLTPILAAELREPFVGLQVPYTVCRHTQQCLAHKQCCRL